MNTRRSAFNTLRRLVQARIPARSDEPAYPKETQAVEPWLQDEMGVGIDDESGHLGVRVLEVEDA